MIWRVAARAALGQAPATGRARREPPLTPPSVPRRFPNGWERGHPWRVPSRGFRSAASSLLFGEGGLQPHGPPPSQSPKAPITERRPAVRQPRHTFGYPDIQAGPVQSGHLPKMARAQTMTSKGTRSHGASTARNSCKRSSR